MNNAKKVNDVGWEAIDFTSKDEKELKNTYKTKSKFLIDENMGIEVVNFLRDEGLNVKFLSDFGLLGHSDEDVFHCAYQEDRILVTHDYDFLDDRRFPPNINPGIVIIPDGNEDHNITVKGLLNMISVVSNYREVWRRSKIIFNKDNTLAVIAKDNETRKMEKTIYKIEKHKTYYWKEQR